MEELHGYASMREYGEPVLGLGARAVEDRLRVARALRGLGRLSAEMARGTRSYSVARELCRVVVPETEAEWLAATVGMSCTEVRERVRGLESGDRPGDPRTVVRPRWWRVELTPEREARLAELRARLVEQTGEHVDDAVLLDVMLVRALAHGARVAGDELGDHRARGDAAGADRADADGPEEEGARDRARMDEGRAPYQVSVHLHGRAGDGRAEGAFVAAGAERVPVDEATVGVALCDGQLLGVVDGEALAARATQTVPPRVRRQVVARHGHRCAVPGCAGSVFLHVHHVVPRSEGGTHAPSNLVALCEAHHRLLHGGALRVVGSAGEGFRFERCDGRRYGSPGPVGGAVREGVRAYRRAG